MATLTPELAGKIYDILVKHAGAPERDEYDRAGFIYSQTSEQVPEYRFVGKLGFGGKFWRNSPPFDNPHNLAESWYVNTYSEDMNPERDRIINETNEALAALNIESGPRQG